MKTPLPEKYLNPKWLEQEKVNQLIDVVAELTEVVRQLESLAYPTIVHTTFTTEGTTPTLKEQLLGALPIRRQENKAWNNYTYNEIVGYNKALEEVEAIINRLIP